MSIPRALTLRPHSGQHELIIGIDVGTTFSGVCYAFLRPGEIPEIHQVQEFTDQKIGDSNIPSILYYDKSGTLRAAGATAVSDNTVYDAESGGWYKVKYFKTHLRPSGMVLDTHGLDLGSLPPMKTAIDVFGDFLRYLYSETISYISERQLDSNELLNMVIGRIKFVLNHPNGWVGMPQQCMREAAVHGGLVKDLAAARSKISFVSEGEASALSCLASGFCPPTLEKGFRFMIADLGGGALDMTSYEVANSSPLRLKELTSSDCRFAGSIFVNIKARKLLQTLLRGTHYDNNEILDELIDDHFDCPIKKQFKDPSNVSWLRVGNRDEINTELGIRRGRLRIDGKDMVECFEHSVSEALKSIRDQIARCGDRPMPVWLVGGFASSDYLFRRLEIVLKRDGIDVRRPSPIDLLAKAVARGNVLYSLGDTVSSRVTRSTFGTVCQVPYNNFDPEHCRRGHLRFVALDGDVGMPGKFDVIVEKNKEVQETQRFNRPYFLEVENLRSASFEHEIYSFSGGGPAPMWHDENEDVFTIACTIKADLSRLYRTSKTHTYDGRVFRMLSYEVEIMFGSTELQARIKWIENGETKYGPATIFYEDEK